jgi:hypothetical protein
LSTDAESKPDIKPIQDPEENAEQAHRRTIAERMAKLGGIKFGAPMVERSSTIPIPGQEGGPKTSGHEQPEAQSALTEEEEEQARKQRIASKLAGMGGMRIGMLPLGASGGSQQTRAKRQSTDDTLEAMSPPSHAIAQRTSPPSRSPPSREVESELESISTSDDGIKVEAEESELEEVTHEDAQEEATPPAIPSRAGRPTPTSRPAVPGSRPPVPIGLPARRNSVQVHSPSSRKSSGDNTLLGRQQSTRREGSGYQRSSASPPRPLPQLHSEYVMVDDPETMSREEAPPRTTRGAPPTRSAPPPPPPIHETSNLSDSVTSQWELPSIPTASLDFSGNTPDLSLSTWSEDSTTYAPPADVSTTPPGSSYTAPGPSNEVQMSSDALIGK